MAGLLVFAAVVLAAAEILTWAAARLLAPSYDVASSDWISAAALGDAVSDYGSVLFWVTGYALLGMTIAVLRSLRPHRPRDRHRLGGADRAPAPGRLGSCEPPLSGAPARRRSSRAGTTEVSSSRALLTLAMYVLIGAAIAATSFARRDITG